MKLRIAWIQAKPGKDKSSATAALTSDYLKRLARYIPVETAELPNEASLIKQLDKSAGRTAPFLVLLDSRGKQLSSEELARFLEKHQDQGTQQLIFAVGGADGFSEEASKAVGFQLSLGKMTLPHELARVILLEQLYRAFTILKGHPYHCGH
jgi:23S rRNA (pseudouridine1915-N3)-methyltransferase